MGAHWCREIQLRIVSVILAESMFKLGGLITAGVVRRELRDAALIDLIQIAGLFSAHKVAMKI